MITVVHVITRLELGGAQENTLYTCAHLDPARYRVVLAFGRGGRLDARAQSTPCIEAVPIEGLVREVAPKRDAAAFRRLVALFRRLRERHASEGGAPGAFVVHTHSSKAGILGRLAAARAEVPVIVHGIHGFGFHEGQNPVKKALFVNAERLASRVTDAFVSVSQTSLAEARSRGLVEPSHVARVIRSGMRLADHHEAPSREVARQQLGLPAEAELIVCVANFKPQKDPLTLIRAFARLSDRRPHARLLYVGDGGLRPQVEALVRELKLEAKVSLLGWRDDVPRLMAACDVVALSSIFEGLPRTAVQAVAARRPFVGTRVDGTPEIIRDGVNGYLVPPRDPERLAEALERGLVYRPVDPEDETRVLAWDADLMVREQEHLYEALVRSS